MVDELGAEQPLAVPLHEFWRGVVAGDPSSMAVLRLHDDGLLTGTVATQGQEYTIEVSGRRALWHFARVRHTPYSRPLTRSSWHANPGVDRRAAGAPIHPPGRPAPHRVRAGRRPLAPSSRGQQRHGRWRVLQERPRPGRNAEERKCHDPRIVVVRDVAAAVVVNAARPISRPCLRATSAAGIRAIYLHRLTSSTPACWCDDRSPPSPVSVTGTVSGGGLAPRRTPVS